MFAGPYGINGTQSFNKFCCSSLSTTPSSYCAVLCSVTQSCPALCNPMDSSLPGSSVHGILQARILEWVAIPFSKICYEKDEILPSWEIQWILNIPFGAGDLCHSYLYIVLTWHLVIQPNDYLGTSMVTVRIQHHTSEQNCHHRGRRTTTGS